MCEWWEGKNCKGGKKGFWRLSGELARNEAGKQLLAYFRLVFSVLLLLSKILRGISRCDQHNCQAEYTIAFHFILFRASLQ
jgi:hypothetical protein